LSLKIKITSFEIGLVDSTRAGWVVCTDEKQEIFFYLVKK